MYILDTDVLGYYLDNPDRFPHLRDRIREADAKAQLCISIITVEEMMAGVIASIRNGRLQGMNDLIQSYEYLFELMNDLRTFIVLPFDRNAYKVFQTIPANITRGRKLDCRIAAIALSRDDTVVTNNGRDFEPIRAATGVRVEYWVNAPLPPA